MSLPEKYCVGIFVALSYCFLVARVACLIARVLQLEFYGIDTRKL